jgi:hypothetical protein
MDEHTTVRVYSQPERFVVGEKDGSYDRAFADWEGELRRAGIGDAAIAHVRVYFAEQQHRRRNELERELANLDAPPPVDPEPLI